jgi:hypothetical protein
LDAAAIKWRTRPLCALEAGAAVGEEQFGVAVRLPETAQHRERGLRQRHQAVAVALGVAHLHAHALGVDIGHRERKALAQPQAETVEGEVEHPIAQHPGGQKQPLRLIDRDDVGQALRLGRLDQVGHCPRLLEHMRGEELQAVEVELDRAPRVGADEVAEILGELRLGERLDAVVEIRAQAPDSAGVGVDGLGLQPLQLQMLEMAVVLPGKVRWKARRHAGRSSRSRAESAPSPRWSRHAE